MQDVSLIADIFAQVPIVAAIMVTAVYFLREIERRDTLWRSFLDEQNKRQDETSRKLTEAIGKLDRQIERNTAVVLLLVRAGIGNDTDDAIKKLFEKDD